MKPPTANGRPESKNPEIYSDTPLMSRSHAFRVLDRLVYGNVLSRHGGQYTWSD
jgi:hypothetical protein